MKLIKETSEYPNLTTDEIIAMDISLAGDALAHFAKMAKLEFAREVDDVVNEAKSNVDSIIYNQVGSL